MTTIKFVFDPNAPGLTWGDFSTIEMLQEGQVKVLRLQKLAARFMVDGAGKYLPHPQAMSVLDDLPKEEMQDVLAKFGDAVRAAAVPPTNGNSSEQPLEVKPPSEFPPGSEQ